MQACILLKHDDSCEGTSGGQDTCFPHTVTIKQWTSGEMNLECEATNKPEASES